MKISWGYKIFIAYMAFVIGILFLVYKANNEKFDLVTEDYYGAELKYQDVINEKDNVAQLSSIPVITHSVDQVNVQLPAEFMNTDVKGEVFLYRPSDASKDQHHQFSINGNKIIVKLKEALSGAYELKLSWQANGKNFFTEKKIFF